MKLLIGIGHKKRSGKDVFARLLTTYITGSYLLHGFSYSLKLQVAEACGVSVSEIEKNKHVFRIILQWWGTEFRRKYQGNDSYWINQVEKFYQGVTVKNLILTDVRFRNEATYVKSKGGILIKIQRDTGELDCHGSECDLDHYKGWDFIINNNGSLEDLEKQAKYIASKL